MRCTLNKPEACPEQHTQPLPRSLTSPPPRSQALYKNVARAMYRTHVEGTLKAEILQDPGRYVELDPEMAQVSGREL